MTANVIGELSADRSTIVLIATGQDHEVLEAAQRLTTLTPVLHKSDPPGAMLCPASWSAAIQLAHTFGPAWHAGPNLVAWLHEQVIARTAPPTELRVTPPPGLVPRGYQVAGAAMIGAVGSALLFDEPRTGKTITTILGLLERAAAGHPVLPIVVVAPSAVVDPWVRELKKWAPRWRTVAWRGSPAKRRKLAGLADVYVTSYGTAARDARTIDVQKVRQGHAPLMALCAKAIVADECLPPGTLIDTPTGPRPIETLVVGDEVLGVDHETGGLVVTTVRHVFTSRTRDALTYVHGVAMTPNHPVWTARGYVPAADVRADDLICEVLCGDDGARDVRVVCNGDGEAPAQGEQAAEVLQPQLLSEVAHVAAGVRRLVDSQAGHAGAPAALCGAYAQAPSSARSAGEAGGASARVYEPVPGPGGAGACTCSDPGARLPRADRRERPRVDGAAGDARRGSGLAYGGCRAHRSHAAVPVLVQVGRRLIGTAHRDRGGRGEPQHHEGPGTRRAQGCPAHGTGLDRSAVPESPGAERSGVGAAHGRIVHNIETGTGNYVAAGLLVHNCHRIKDPGSTYSRAVRNLATHSRAFVGLSGTPITHSPKDLWPALYSMCPSAYPSSERWVLRYCDSIPGEYASKVIGLNVRAEPEFRQTLLGQYRRVARADVLNELPKVHSVRLVELPQEYRDAYDAVEGEMLADLPDDGGELSPMTVLSQMTGLSAIASAAADVETTWEEVEDPETGEMIEKRHQHIELKLPSWKVDELLSIMAERPGYAIAAFAPSSQLMRLAGQAAAEKGYRVGYVIGGQTSKERTRHVDAFQARDLDLLCATTGAGGVGLTLSAADSLVFLQRPWSLVESLQAEDRAEGDESKERGTEIIDIVAANTIESRVRQILVERADQLSKLVQDPRIVIELLGGAKVRNLRKSVAA